jgi:3-hydroxy-9,10-secoandrosta-1,3,5(10)-triene-9,17-dione monooxygenase reductase component
VPAPSPDEFRLALGELPTGVTVVSAPADDHPAGATAGAVSSLSLDPPLMLAALDRGSRTLAALTAARRFGVSVLAAGQEEVARSFATKDPHPVKWAEVAFSDRDGVPVIDGAVLWVVCDLRDLHDGGDHVIAVGAVAALGTDESESEPLLFYRGSYRALE